eukprot:788981-Amphidinium_carterae.1
MWASLRDTVARDNEALQSKFDDLLNKFIALHSSLSSSMAGAATFSSPSFVLNESTGVVHKVRNCSVGTPVTLWCTQCGWRFGQSSHMLTPDIDEEFKLCGKCWPGDDESDSLSSS